MNIVLLEDDHLQADWIRSELVSELGASVRVVRTEMEFREILSEWQEHPPDIVVLDVIVRWTDPRADIPRPPEDVRNGPARAGIRCGRRFAEYCPNVPIILYTVLDAVDLEADLTGLPERVITLSKEATSTPLINAIGLLLGRD
ncbi:MAG: hypothetical protein V3W34_07565 [Phycisphaerae bacterium]